MQDIKLLQYCKQARRILSMGIVECGLEDAQVVEVIAMERSRLLVVVSLTCGGKELELARQLWQRLHHHEGRLRAMLAQGTHRKKTPVLEFQVLI